MAGWREFRWRVVRFGAGENVSFVWAWIYAGILLFALLQIYSKNYTAVFLAALFGGEIFAGVSVRLLARVANRPSFPAYSVERTTEGRDIEALRFRIGEALSDIKWYLTQRVGSENFEEFVRRPLVEHESLLPEEVPKSYGAMVQAITTDLLDRALGHPRPWSPVRDALRGLRRSFSQDSPTKAARLALSNLYVNSGSAYRRAAASAEPELSPPR